MILTSFGLLAAVLTGNVSLDWEAVDSVRAVGYEQIAKGSMHAFTVAREGRAVVYSCAKDIDGELNGVLRTELINDQGVFTWVSDNPKLVLQLPQLSAPEVAASVYPVRFSRSQLFGNPAKLSRQIGRKVEIKGKDSVASRDCQIVAFSDRTPLVESVWVDSKTGMALRRQDKIGGDIVYDRFLSSLQTDQPLPSAMFASSGDAIVVRGLVSPSILLAKRKNSLDFQSDLNQLRSGSGLLGGGWISPVVIPMEFAYMGTSHQEGEPLPTAPTVSLPQLALHSGYASINSPAQGIPTGIAVPGQVVINGGAIYFGADAPPNELSRDLSSQLAGSSNYDPNQSMLGFGGRVNPDGSVTTFAKSSDPKPSPSPNSLDASGLGMIRSEFLNPRTGDTITYLQLHNISIIAAFRQIPLPTPKFVSDARFGKMATYQVLKPFRLHVVEWESGGSEYALVSDKLTTTELQGLADQGFAKT